jgi:hypothetical protein
MANLTGAERAKRYRQRKAGKKAGETPRAARRNAVWLLWQLECRFGDRRSLRTFYRQRAGCSVSYAM